MASKYSAAAVTLAVSAVAFLTTFAIWPNPPGALQPPSTLLPFFAVLSIIECLAFGLGVTFMVFGGARLAALGQGRRLTILAYVCTAWLLVNWWPHDNLHRVTGFEWVGLLKIEYGFHVTLMIAGAVVAYFFWKVVTATQSGEPRPDASARTLRQDAR
jgi:hypothetical protein